MKYENPRWERGKSPKNPLPGRQRIILLMNIKKGVFTVKKNTLPALAAYVGS